MVSSSQFSRKSGICFISAHNVFLISYILAQRRLGPSILQDSANSAASKGSCQKNAPENCSEALAIGGPKELSGAGTMGMRAPYVEVGALKGIGREFGPLSFVRHAGFPNSKELERDVRNARGDSSSRSHTGQ
jgi:hypothetical protein